MSGKIVSYLNDLPNEPTIYLFVGIKEKIFSAYKTNEDIDYAYIGESSNLKARVNQHLFKHDTSVTTGTSTACINPDYVKEVWWWEHPKFSDDNFRKAAELIATEVRNPTLRSQSKATSKSKEILKEDNVFCEEMRSLFKGEPTGKYIIKSLKDAWKEIEKIKVLEEKIDYLESEVKVIRNKLTEK